MHKSLLLFLSLLWTSYVQAHDENLVACIDDHPPYQYLSDKPYGTHISALETLSKVLDKHLKFEQSPNFARCILMLKKGDVDVVAGLNPTEERSEFAFYAPFKSADTMKVVSKKGISINTYSDFKDKIIGVARGTLYFPRFDNDNSLKKIAIQSSRIGFSLLLKDRIDLIMISPAMLATLTEEINNADLKVSPIALEELRNKKTFFGFSKRNKINLKHRDLINKVTTAYQQGIFK
ncbi:transporter substrate-binding domain-containing protein [Pseudoalteromonas sp. C2R02]|uniref:substrate-binding periplasmic protein n=1 Tax=Pseudoalteromonas sp. C2R02 TaxID=2841565 RepID=UPI001C0A61E5|nr:transporter substrate-binding domain-containing protein [Pseudoalteromonas sp. C2R02]MBU2969177.1 transporter substrate-binding domain-containing protein [Pseudoalteromonas sp. C2R02]